MRHRAKGKQLSRTASHKKALLANLATSLFRHDRIQTTQAKAKELRPYAASHHAGAPGDLHAMERKLKIGGHAPLFTELGKRFATRPGGYTRIVKLGHRPGDGADVARIELLSE
jgi:large subunit ribosomal protein L17